MVTAIILAGGRGNRMKSNIPKQYIKINEKMILSYTVEAFEKSLVDQIVIVSGKGDEEFCYKELVEKEHYKKIAAITAGGKERYDSVYQGLLCCGKETDYVLVHDGARCFITPEGINRTIEEVKEKKACIMAVPVKDTMKEADPSGKVIRTIPRENLFSIQTPQAFEYDLLRKAHEKMRKQLEEGWKEKMITDDAMVIETFSDQDVYLIKGEEMNIKLTSPEDLAVAQTLLKK